MEKKLSYDAEYDILYLNVGKKVEESVPVGDFVVDFASDGSVAGIEVMNASENLSLYSEDEVSTEDLENLEDADISLREGNHMTVAVLEVRFAGAEVGETVPLNLERAPAAVA